jgi:hypothetical protein
VRDKCNFKGVDTKSISTRAVISPAKTTITTTAISKTRTTEKAVAAITTIITARATETTTIITIIKTAISRINKALSYFYFQAIPL